MTKGLNEQAFRSRPLSESLYPVLWVDVVISDAHSGLVAAIRKGFPGASWQRCKVHFMRNILAHLAPTREQACSQAEALCRLYERRFPKAIRRLEDGLEDSLAFYAFPQLDARKISSTNLLERLNREIRRRTSTVGIFPNPDSYTRLVTTYLMEYAEDWSSSRAYLSEQSVHALLRPAA